MAEQDKVIWVSGLPRRAPWNMQCQALLLKLEKVLASCDCVYKYIFVYVYTHAYIYMYIHIQMCMHIYVYIIIGYKILEERLFL